MFDDYLTSVNASSVLRKRIDDLYSRVTNLIPATELPHAFISNSFDEENNLQWRSLWFYGPRYASELSKFQWSDSFDCVNVAKSGVERIDITSENFDFIKAEPHSKYSIKWGMVGDVAGAQAAVGINCDQLLHFTRLTVLPHIL